MIGEKPEKANVEYRPGQPLLAGLDDEVERELENAPPEVQNRVRSERLERARLALEEKELEFRRKERRFETGKQYYKAVIEAEPRLRKQRLILAVFSMVMLVGLMYVSLSGFNRNQIPYLQPPEVVLDPYEKDARYRNVNINLPKSVPSIIIVKMKVMKDAQTIGLHVDGGDVVGFDSADQFKRIKDSRRLVRFTRTWKNPSVLLLGEQTVSFQIRLDGTQSEDAAKIYGWAAIRGWAKNAHTGNGGKRWFWQELKLRVQTTPPATLPGFSGL